MRGAPTRLRCEYQDNPLGVTTARPRLSWWVNDPRPAELQTAYQVQAASSATGLQAGAADLWDTGHVSSNQTVNVEYRGGPLAPGDHVWWRVRCYDSDGTPSPWSAAARFELALTDWQAAWVAAPLMGSPGRAVPAPLLLRDFELPRVPVWARLQVAVLGSVCLELNGSPITALPLGGEGRADAGRVACRVLDVTRLLRTGGNRLGALLGDGAFAGHEAGGPRQRHGERPSLAMQLVVELGNGERRSLATGSDWRWRPSWVLQADRDGGEEVDARQMVPGWSSPDTALRVYPVDLAADLAVRPMAARAPALTVLGEHELEVLQRTRAADGRTRLRYDAGCELLGRVRLTLRAARGTVLRLSYGLRPPPPRPGADAEPAPPLQWGPAVDRYTCRGDGDETFEPQFALHAFRFVELEVDGELHDLRSATAREIGSGAATSAGLECDHALLQAYFRAALRTARLGLALGPVAGLTGPCRQPAWEDAAAFLTGTGSCLDAATTFREWLDVAPAESTVGCLWFMYRSYGDRQLLEQAYPAVQAHLRRRAGTPLLDLDGEAPLVEQMLALGWYGFDLSVATRMAGVLGRRADLEGYDARFTALREAFRDRFVSGDGLLMSDHQLGYLLALELGVFSDPGRAIALRRLESQLRRDGFHSAVDVRHASRLLEVLTLEGRLDLAYQVLLQTSSPAWLQPLHAGADLLWDAASGVPGRLAAVCLAGWLQRFLLGLELDDNLTPELNAYRRVRVQPRPPLGPGFAAGAPVRRAAGHLDTVHGRFECVWEIDVAAFRLVVQVPGNCSARVILPDGSERLVMAGSHEFAMALPAVATPGLSTTPTEVPVLNQSSGGR